MKIRNALRVAFVVLAEISSGNLCWADEQTQEVSNAILGTPCPSATKEDCLTASLFTITIIKTYGDYVKADVRRKDGLGDTETAYLEKHDGKWIVLDQGTGVDPSTLGIPKEAW